MLKWSTSTKLITYILLIPFVIHSCSGDTSPSTPNPGQQKDSKPSRECITLYLEYTSSFPEYKYSTDGSGKIQTYEAYDNFGFNKIVGTGGNCGCLGCGDQTLWETQSKDQSAIKVVLQDQGSGNLTAIVTFQDNSTKTYNRPGKCGDWKETSSSDSKSGDNSNALNPVELIFNNKQESGQYSYKAKDKIDTFEVKQGYGFSKLKQSPSYSWVKYLVCYCCFSCCCKSACFETKTIWKAESESQYATKVTYNSSSDKLELVLADKSTKVLEKKGSFGSKQWTETQSTQPPKNQNLKAKE